MYIKRSKNRLMTSRGVCKRVYIQFKMEIAGLPLINRVVVLDVKTTSLAHYMSNHNTNSYEFETTGKTFAGLQG